MATPDDWADDNPSNGTWWDTAKNVGQTVDDTVRATANAMTFGGADRYAGAMEGLASGKGYSAGVDEQVKLSEEARKRSPYASVAGDVAGAVALPGFGAAKLATRLGGGAVARALGYGATGAAAGAAQGAGNVYSEKPSDYLSGAAYGAMIGGPLGAIGGAAFGRGPAVSSAKVPTIPELVTEKTANYADLARSGARYEPSTLARRADDVEAALYGGGNSPNRFHPSRSPQTWEAIEQMRGAPAPGQMGVGSNAIIDPANIDFIRKGLTGDAIAGASPTEKASAKIVRNALDDFIENPPPGAVLPGTERAASEAAGLANRARGNYAGLKRLGEFENMVDRAKNKAGRQYSGLNLENELRKEAGMFTAPSRRGPSYADKAGYNKAEIAALNQFEKGTPSANALRYAGNYLGGGGGLGALVTTGAGVGYAKSQDPETAGLLGAAGAGTGLTLRLLANRRANQNMGQIRDMVAMRNPLYQARAANAPMVPGPGSPRAAKAVRDALALEILQQTQPRRLDIDTTDWE